MGIFELFVLAVGLSMDAFAVSVCKGLSLGKIGRKHMFIAGAWFGGFQALMPLIGYYLGRFFTDTITEYDHWIATSIDALAVGVTFAFLKVSIIPAVSFIGVVTFVCSAVGVKIGSIFGTKYRARAELCGGIILILIGTKILLEGVGII